MAKVDLQTKLLNSLKDHASTVQEVINDPEFEQQTPTIKFAVNIYARTLALTVSNWEKAFDDKA